MSFGCMIMKIFSRMPKLEGDHYKNSKLTSVIGLNKENGKLNSTDEEVRKLPMV